jgi:hypothetical protein
MEPEEVGRSLVFGSPRHGAVFYVTAAQASHARHALVEGGFARGVVSDAGLGWLAVRLRCPVALLGALRRTTG